MADQAYDLVIIGSGPGGYVAGIRAGQLGMKVAVVEKDSNVGGTCLLRGCIPTKALLENADIWHKIQKSKEFGITVGDAKLDFSAVQTRKQGVVNANVKGIEFLFRKNKVERIAGFAKVVDRNTVDVDGKQLETKNIILAMGSVPRDLPHIKTDGKRIINSDHILELKDVPKSMLVIGAGAVGCEFASIFARFGTKVTSCEGGENGVKSVIETKGKQQTIETELVLSATGRRAVTENCGLEKTKVQLERGMVQVNPYMQTAEPGIYAIGDIVPTPALAHVASAEGILAVEHMKGMEVRTLNYDHVPNCTYTDPEVASVGLTEKKAKERGYDVKTGKFPFTANSKAKILGEAVGFVKYVSEKKYDEVLGVHIVGPRATELIVEGCAALELEATTESIAKTIHAHPTLSEALMEAAEDVLGHSIHQ